MSPDSTYSSSQFKSRFFISAVNGTLLYALAYWTVNFVHQLATVLTAKHFHIRGQWGISRIFFTAADAEWWRRSIVIIYGIGPLLCVVMGLLAWGWFWFSLRTNRGLFKLLLVWIALHTCNTVLGALPADTLTHSGIWYVPNWLFELGPMVNIILAILAAVGQILVGYQAGHGFLQAHDSQTVMQYANRKLMVVATILVPWVVGSVIIMLFKFPFVSMQELLHLLAMGLLVIPMCLNCLLDLAESTVRSPQATRIAWGLAGVLLLVALLWRFELNPPVLFG